jgi:hypothetical protein
MEYGISHVKEGPGPHRHKALQVRSTLSKLRGPIPRPAPTGQHPYAAHLATILSPLCVLGDLCGDRPIMQNKPNFKIGKPPLNPCCEKHYGKIHPLRPPTKQSQTNPICRGEASGEAGSNPISNAETAQWCQRSHSTGLEAAGRRNYVWGRSNRARFTGWPALRSAAQVRGAEKPVPQRGGGSTYCHSTSWYILGLAIGGRFD